MSSTNTVCGWDEKDTNEYGEKKRERDAHTIILSRNMHCQLTGMPALPSNDRNRIDIGDYLIAKPTVSGWNVDLQEFVDFCCSLLWWPLFTFLSHLVSIAKEQKSQKWNLTRISGTMCHAWEHSHSYQRYNQLRLHGTSIDFDEASFIRFYDDSAIKIKSAHFFSDATAQIEIWFDCLTYIGMWIFLKQTTSIHEYYRHTPLHPNIAPRQRKCDYAHHATISSKEQIHEETEYCFVISSQTSYKSLAYTSAYC